jgi:TPP-dependent pyruvate/acetoin dehydrogenase alpha subunit
VRVDGNDVLAMYATVKEAVDRARSGEGPTFIEALTYRIGPHSSSDDPTRYRDEAEPTAWREKKDPLLRFGKWLASTGVLSEADQSALNDEVDAEIRQAIALEEAAGPPPLRSMIEDVFAEPNWILEEQLAELERVRAKGK